MDKEQNVSEETQIPENKEISVNYVSTGDIWDRDNIIVGDIFAFKIAFEIIKK